jgi:glycosyltransferase involved in cell wall biosynthesis
MSTTDASERPVVSIVVATYNRSSVLSHTLQSARAQTFTDWEMWVVGDACTDDTAEVVASLGDERISFVNLDTNNGDQAVPNNEGVARSSGRMIAFLNHDDLWFPDHLERCVHHLATTPEAAGVFSPVVVVTPAGGYELWPSPTSRFEAGRVQAPASGWLMRRETIDRVGPWRRRHETFDAPSFDWLLRALRGGERIDQLPYVTALAPQSGRRPGSYATRDDSEQRRLAERIQANPHFREEVVTEIALEASAALRLAAPARHVRQAVRDAGFTLFKQRWTGVYNALRYRRRGGHVDNLRRIRGLPPQ